MCSSLGIEWKQAKNALDKNFETENCASIGNGNIDVEMFKTVKLAIATLQAEGLSQGALINSHVIVPNINDALDLLIKKERLVATLRK